MAALGVRLDADEPLDLTQEALAEALGVRRATVTTALKNAVSNGSVQIERGKVQLVDRDRWSRKPAPATASSAGRSNAPQGSCNPAGQPDLGYPATELVDEFQSLDLCQKAIRAAGFSDQGGVAQPVTEVFRGIARNHDKGQAVGT